MSIYIAPRTAPPVKASPMGPGSAVLQTEFPLATYGIGGAMTAQKKMKRFWSLALSIPWVTAAEDAIGERFAAVDWHLEDENDDTVTDATTNADALAALQLMEAPGRNVKVGAPYYRTDLWSLTCRAMGVCGSAFIFMDQQEALGGTPAALLPIAPWRMTPKEDTDGNLEGWFVDRTQASAGIALRVDQVLHYQLRRSLEGHFGVGNMEAALKKANISVALDDHLGLVLSSGGRLSGILSPAQGIIDPDIMLQMERDWRNVVEQSDAAKRLQLVRAPVKFDRTTLTPQELQIRNLLDGSRDDLLTIWGVPLSIVGGTTPSGLNSGDTRKYDEAAIWQGPVHSRLTTFREVTQYQMLDRFATLGATVELEIDEPEFDDDSPRYDLLGKSLNLPMRNSERRALIGLDPLGDPALDDAILLPVTIAQYSSAPTEAAAAAPSSSAAILGRAPDTTPSAPDPAASAAGETSDGASAAKATLKPHIAALSTSLRNLRANVARHATPRIKTAVGDLLREQKSEIVAKLRKNADAIAKRPADMTTWWDGAKWDRKMTEAIRPHAVAMAQSVSSHIETVLPAQKAGGPAPAGAVERVLSRGAARVTGINATTRDKIQEAVIRGLNEGLSVLEVADLIEGGSEVSGLEVGTWFDEYRAEMIARTELGTVYNEAAIGAYRDFGLDQVEVIDGDDDPECAAADGSIWSMDEADANPLEHPNCVRDFAPYFGGADLAAADEAL